MYLLKYTTLEMKFCPKCRAMIMHEKGKLLHRKDENEAYVELFGVYECIGCGYVYDPNGRILPAEYTRS